MSVPNTNDSSQVNTTSVKLPDFWTKSPAVWFARIEAQFSTKGITQDQIKYDFVVSALDSNTAEEIQHILINPPATNKYESLKKALNKTFGKSQYEKDTELLHINGLGDRRPSALMRRISALNNDPKTLKRAIFLTNLPSEIRSTLVAQNIQDADELAEAADRVWESRVCTVNATSTPQSSLSPITDQSTESVEAVSTGKKSRKPDRQDAKSASICFYHTRFGVEARKCQGSCKFASLLNGTAKAPGMAAAGGSDYNTLCAQDRHTGTTFLIDTGADVSVFPATKHERRTPTQPLSAANYSSIQTWGSKEISLTLGERNVFKHNFKLADVKRPILGADFFIAHHFLIVLRGRRLISHDHAAVNIKESTIPLADSGWSLSSFKRLVLRPSQ